MEIVGIPKERKPGETRVGLAPAGVKALTRNGVYVLVEKGAGEHSGYSDAAYEKAGALIVSTARRLWKGATLIKKVKEPQASEYDFLQSKHTLFTFLHLASQENCELVRRLISSGATGIAYETVVKNGENVILNPMSEIAGVIAAYFAGILSHLVEVRGGEIVFHSWYPKVLERALADYPKPLQGNEPGKVLILGGGRVGRRAAEIVQGMGGKVVLLEKDRAKREALVETFMKEKIWVNVISPEDDWLAELAQADVLIGAVHVHGERAPLIVTEEMLRAGGREKRKIVIDVAVDQGGNVSGSRSTTLDEPLYLDPFGNIRFGVANIPSLARGLASAELEKATLDYTLALAEDRDLALKRFPELGGGINVLKGKLLHEAVAQAHQIKTA
jgi:alanine dehydrogenase